MRIQNNITAMNTHRQYTINNENVAKSAEKLSSGYRINRAGDDAAGLAISEKMRSQIRGLNMATKNSQDAISLVQTAEGALQETQNMLQRMNELAVQAATGTNETLDRNALAKEFEQLKREINDIAEQTTFNNMKILDGSLSYSGYVRSAATAGVTTTVEDMASTPAANNITKTTTAAVDGSQGVREAQGVLTINAGSDMQTLFVTNGSDLDVKKGSDSVTVKNEGDVSWTFDLGITGVGPIKIDAKTDGATLTAATAAAATEKENSVGKALEQKLIDLRDAANPTTEEAKAAKAVLAKYDIEWTGNELKLTEKKDLTGTPPVNNSGQGTIAANTAGTVVRTDNKTVGPAAGATPAATDGTVKANFAGDNSLKAHDETGAVETKAGTDYTLQITSGSGANTVVHGEIKLTGAEDKSVGDLLDTWKAQEGNGPIELKDANGNSLGHFNVEFNVATGALDLHQVNGETASTISVTLKLNLKSETNPAGIAGSFAPGAAEVGAADATAASKTFDIKLPSVEKPDKPESLSSTATDAEKEAYKAAMTKYEADLAAYNKDQEESLKDGATLKIDGKTYTFKAPTTKEDGTVESNAVKSNNEFGSLEDLAKLINENQKSATDSSKTGIVSASVDGTKLTLTALQKIGEPSPTDGLTKPADDASDADKAAYQEAVQKNLEKGVFTKYEDISKVDVEMGAPAGAGKKTTVEFDFAKLQDGDAVKITIGGKDIEVQKETGDTRKSFMDKVQSLLDDKIKDERVKVGGNALISEGVEVKVEMELVEDGLKDKETNALRIQVGALENEQLSVAIDSMNTKGLGLDDAFLMSQNNPTGALTIDQDAAGDAITKTRAAINKVSDQRATLGAMQNRLDHKIANLKVASENLSASESRIRDVDMAQEMTNFTKNNILSQAATAMLAQANSLPQNVLSLLG